MFHLRMGGMRRIDSEEPHAKVAKTAKGEIGNAFFYENFCSISIALLLEVFYVPDKTPRSRRLNPTGSNGVSGIPKRSVAACPAGDTINQCEGIRSSCSPVNQQQIHAVERGIRSKERNYEKRDYKANNQFVRVRYDFIAIRLPTRCPSVH